MTANLGGKVVLFVRFVKFVVDFFVRFVKFVVDFFVSFVSFVLKPRIPKTAPRSKASQGNP